MFYRISLAVLFVSLCIANTPVVIAAETGLELQQAEQLAVRNDPVLNRFASVAGAMKESAVANAQLPDPKFQFGLMNFPVDTFRRDQEPMTQIQFGLSQAFPRGDSRKIQAYKSRIEARSMLEKREDRRLMVLRSIRSAWLELYYWQQARQIVEKNLEYFRQMVEVTRYQYGAGKRSQQDVIRAQLELSRVQDRLLEIQANIEKARADLQRWVGNAVRVKWVAGYLPQANRLSSLEVLRKQLQKHPLLKAAGSRVDARRQDVALAREAYKPGFSIGVLYGVRDGVNINGSQRPDFASAMLTLDVPLFRAKRQDKRLKASELQASAARYEQDNLYRMLTGKLDNRYAEWMRLNQRVDYFHKVLMPQAIQNAEVSLDAYQNDKADFTTLMRARITALDLHLQAVRLRVNRARVYAEIQYLAGGKK